MRGLEGVRVLELGEGVAAAYAAKLMGDLGADVIKVEPPGGDRARFRGPFPDDQPDPERSGLFLYLNTNKRGITLDLSSPEGREALESLVAESDILVHNLSPTRMEEVGLRYEALRELQPALVMASITPFGLFGPYSRYRAEELTITNAGGWAWLSPGALERADAPPLKAFGHQSDFQGGLAGAMTSLAAYQRALQTGIGEHIDLSIQEYIASFLEQALPVYTYAGQVATRHGARGLNPWAIFECSDGLIFLCVIEEDQWERLVDFMGNPEWAQPELFDTALLRLQNHDVLRMFVQEWISGWTVDELFHEGQKRRVCFAPVLTMEALSDHEHLRERGFYVEVDHPVAGALRQPGPPYLLTEPWWRVRRPAPQRGEHNAEILERPATAARPATPAPASASGLPLEGVRVVDLSWVWAGPFCAMQLAHLGAEVIKIESEGRPDLARRLPIFAPEVEPSLNTSGYFNQWNQGKRSVSVNLGHPDGIEVVKRLIGRSDVVVENFATGVMDRLGLDYETLRALRPDLIVASISGYGGAGPLCEYMAYGPAIAPLSGLSALTGYAGEGPREVGISLGDPTAGVNAAVAVCAALAARRRTGEGQYIDVSLWESVAALVPEGFMEWIMNGRAPVRMGNRDPRMAPHGCYRSAGEDEWVSIACADEAEWQALCGVVDPTLGDDGRFRTARSRKENEDELDKRLQDWTQTRDRWEITRALQGVGVAAFPSLTPEDLIGDPHLAARGFFARLDHPEVGVRTHAGIPWRLAGGPNGVRTPAPTLGADTDSVLREICGYSSDEIARLNADKALL